MVNKIVVGTFHTNAYIFTINKKECCIIDPGANSELIISTIERMNLIPKGIICTHGHIDHIAAIPDIVFYYSQKNISFPLIAHKEDFSFFGKGSLDTHKQTLLSMGIEPSLFFPNLLEDFPVPDFLVEEDDMILNTDLCVIHTPGHTPGSMSLYSEKTSLVFSGDTLFSKGIGRTDLAGGSYDQIKNSIVNKLMILPAETRVYPGHGPSTSIERETFNDFT